MFHQDLDELTKLDFVQVNLQGGNIHEMMSKLGHTKTQSVRSYVNQPRSSADTWRNEDTHSFSRKFFNIQDKLTEEDFAATDAGLLQNKGTDLTVMHVRTRQVARLTSNACYKWTDR